MVVGPVHIADGGHRRFRTHEAIREIERLVGVRLDRTTLAEWVRKGIVMPSIKRAARNGLGHDWSGEDIIGLAWLAQLQHDGQRASLYGAALRELWRRLPSLLGQEGPLYVVASGRDVTIMSLAEMIRLLAQGPQTRVCLWPVAGTVAQVIADLSRDRQHLPRGGQPG